MPPKFSAVVPIFNEQETLPELYRRLEAVFAKMGESYEIIFIDDGSRDGSLEVMRGLAAKNPAVKVLSLSRNFGLQTAYSAGLDHASGDAVIPMDGDLQDPPELIPDLVAKFKEGYDVVYTIKAKRKEGVFKRFLFAAFYRILRAAASVEMPLDAGSFSILSRRVVDVFKALPEKNRLISGIRAWVGYKQVGLSFERDARFHGEPRQTFFRLLRMATDGLFAFSTVPIRMATVLGFFACGIGLIFVAIVVYMRLFTDLVPSGYASLMVAITFLGGVQLVFIGVLGEYICRIFDEVKNRPLYLLKEKVGFDQ